MRSAAMAPGTSPGGRQRATTVLGGALGLGAILVTLSACAPGAGTTPTAFTVTDSAGVQIVESHGTESGDTLIRVDPEPLLRLGREEEGPEQFSFISRGLLLDDGRIAIAEAAAAELRVFDASGGHLMTFGGQGDGPGEMRSLAGVFDFRGDSVAIDDQRLARITIVSLETGDYRTVPHGVEGNFAAFGVDGAARTYFFNPGRGFRPDLEPGLQWDVPDIVRGAPEDGTPTVITRLPSRQQIVLADGNVDVLIPAHNSIRSVARDGFYWATTDRYDIGFYDAVGTLRRILRRPVEPAAVTEEMIDEFIETELERVLRFEGEAAVPRYRRRYEEGTYGDVVPLFALAFVDRNERLWVLESRWPSGLREARLWSVFTPDGRWLGRVEAPEAVRVLDSRDDIVLGVWQDEFDVPHVQLHRVAELRP